MKKQKVNIDHIVAVGRKARWDTCCEEYLKAFCDKHELQYDKDCWIGNDIGEVAEICDMCIDMRDIRYDLDNEVPEEKFTEWYYKQLDAYEQLRPFPNYESFCNGAPTNLPKETDEEVQKRILSLKESLQALADEDAQKRKARIEKEAYEYASQFKSVIAQQAAKAAFIKGATCTDTL